MKASLDYYSVVLIQYQENVLYFFQIAVLTGRKKANAKRKIEDVEKYKKDVGRSDQDEAEYQKSKLHLQAKARLYEKMSKGDIEGIFHIC